jgi:hypothetical protein
MSINKTKKAQKNLINKGFFGSQGNQYLNKIINLGGISNYCVSPTAINKYLWKFSVRINCNQMYNGMERADS